jgi:hypothetical protein
MKIPRNGIPENAVFDPTKSPYKMWEIMIILYPYYILRAVGQFILQNIEFESTLSKAPLLYHNYITKDTTNIMSTAIENYKYVIS